MSIDMRIGLKKVCRSCLQNTTPGNFQSLLKDPARGSFIKCFNIYINKSDKLPSRICNPCLLKCHDFLKFKSECETNDRFLKQLVTYESEDEDELDVPEVTIKLDLNADTKVIVKEMLEAVMSEADESMDGQNESVDENMNDRDDDPYDDDDNNGDDYVPGQDHNGSNRSDSSDQSEEEVQSRTIKRPKMKRRKTDVVVKEDIKDCIVVPIEAIEEVVINCPVCLGDTEGYKAFQTHIMTHTQLNGTMGCSLCAKTYSNHEGYQKHMYHHTNLTFKCSQCGKICKTPKVLKDHMRGMHMVYLRKKVRSEPTGTVDAPSNGNIADKETLNTIEILCPVCLVSNTGCIEFQNHMLSHVQTINGAMGCTICEKSLPNRESYHNHMYKHTNLQFNCTDCRKYFDSPKGLKDHLRTMHMVYAKKQPKRETPKSVAATVTAKPEITRPESDAGEQEQGEYTKETEKEFGLHNISCPICMTVCDNQLNFNLHLSVHIPTGSQNCPICQKKCTRMSTLKTHMISHTNKVQKCKYCHRIYSNPNSYKRHVNLAHGALKDRSSFKKTKQAQFCCGFCGKYMKNNNMLQEHLMKYHDGQANTNDDVENDNEEDQCYEEESQVEEMEVQHEAIICPLCEHLVPHRNLFGNHLIEAHTTATNCNICNVMFGSYSVLVEHMAIHNSWSNVYGQYEDQKLPIKVEHGR